MTLAVVDEGLDDDVRKVELAARSQSLRLTDEQLTAFALERRTNCKSRRGEVDGVPLQAEQFAGPEAEQQTGDVQRFESVTACCVENRFRLVDRQRSSTPCRG